jgi:hypothetical protein
MAFDTSTRNRLAKFVGEARRLLTDEFIEQLQSLYGISATGSITPIERLGHLDAEGRELAGTLRQRIAYLVSAHADARDATEAAVARLIREQAFTIVNRLAAIRMAETRGLVVESVGQQYQSRGFKVFESVAGSAIGETFDRYRCYLFCLFDELAIDLGVLFDRKSPQAMLFPREPALLALLDLLDAPDLQPLWAEDETIGWIYQYYNDEAERKKMRDESAVPRNSRELAVRNQFFTPRYVVEFLTDNTLGRIWYEMTQGQTCLKGSCRSLVRRPNEIFLRPGEPTPENAASSAAEAGSSLSQEELRNQPVHIPHRPLKDPREIRLLDPACGSMHFGLYAFDLFTVIYDEAWETAHSGDVVAKSADTFAPFLAFAAGFADKAAFLRDVPRLIIEHNLHGIDIDPRAAQIAGLSLWLRAQRAWHQANVKPGDRPRITRSNIVCAEPMPGDKELLREFVEQQFPLAEQPAFGFLLGKIFDQMKLAGEAGSLLRIEEEIRTAIAEAKKLWQKEPAREQAILFQDLINTPPENQKTFDFSGITDEQFWQGAEQRIYEALEAYAEQAETNSGLSSQLFADDAARGFAFIAQRRTRYDAIVMNPPFGIASQASDEYIAGQYKWRSKNLLCAFVACGRQLAPSGLVGAISDSTWLKKTDYEDFRRAVLESHNQLQFLIDLGWGVLDGANVATCCFTTTNNGRESATVCVTRLNDVAVDDKQRVVIEALCPPLVASDRNVCRSIAFFSRFPGQAIAYETPDELIPAFHKWKALQPTYCQTRRGYTPGDTFRYFRCWWEVPIAERNANWWPLNNGGSYAPLVGDGLISAKYEATWESYRPLTGFRLESESWFGTAGLAWGKRTDFMYAYPFPAGAMFSNEGHCAFPVRASHLLPLLAYLNSNVAQDLLNLYCGQHKTAGYVADLPSPDLSEPLLTAAGEIARNILTRVRSLSRRDETAADFVAALLPAEHPNDAVDAYTHTCERYRDDLQAIDCLVAESLTGEKHPLPSAMARPEVALSRSTPTTWWPRTISYGLGVAFGRWDVRWAIDPQRSLKASDPFALHPPCTPGMLQGDDRLPLSPEAGRRLRDAGHYPLDVAWDGILVDDPAHPLDIERRIHAALAVIWGDRVEAIENEACTMLGAPALRDWFRRPASFFADHLKRYSKSRRQAPIYWPLSTKSGDYTLWLYYQRLDDQTLHKCLADFLDPKIAQVEKDISSLTGKSAAKAAELRDFLNELKGLRDEIERVIKLPWRPNLNDGVLITASPLWKLFRLAEWSKDLKACWDELEKGDYDWAHLAYAIWPARVEKVCESDRSIAIAHGLEHLCKVEPPKPKKPRGKKATS